MTFFASPAAWAQGVNEAATTAAIRVRLIMLVSPEMMN
jgi:hypothetical protein